MEETIQADIKMLPTDDEMNARLGVFQDTGNLILRDGKDIPQGIPLHVYLVHTDNSITLDKREYVYINRTQTVEVLTPELFNKFRSNHEQVQKVIASTDEKLGLPVITDELLVSMVEVSRSDLSLDMRVNIPVERTVCANCGEPKDDHNYRHMFVPKITPAKNKYFAQL